MQQHLKYIPLLALAGALTACQEVSDMRGLSEPAPLIGRASAPEGAAPGTCWDQDVTPARIETVTEQHLVTPAALDGAGRVLVPAVYRTETRQAITQERKTLWVETLCADEMTPEMVSSIQRALAARGWYQGPITGAMDRGTRIAIRRYQTPRGLNSALLSRDVARELGLIVVERPAPQNAG
ncbi:peptidoglycan-binding protein [Alphaproteobacteria bacterium KMM 3653]|uniref:Peptidoglycan-binding protein n=2 Tax=Harenicola maris TaxID=2841044 RepID=A0AAP2CT77_9RHOB|nr:peptidoglycan-binding protein [Harenicola maris]